MRLSSCGWMGPAAGEDWGSLSLNARGCARFRATSTTLTAAWPRPPPPTRSSTSTAATTTSRPTTTTPSGASTSAGSARRRCSASSPSCWARTPGRTRARSRSARAPATSRSTSSAPGSSGTPPAPTSRPACWRRSRPTRASSGARSRPPPATPPSCRSRTHRSTWSSGHAVLHHLPALERSFAEFARVLRPGGTLFFAGEPSRQGDRIAAWPKRAAMRAAPLWRRAVKARPAPTTAGRRAPTTPSTRSSRWSTCTRSTPATSSG